MQFMPIELQLAQVCLEYNKSVSLTEKWSICVCDQCYLFGFSFSGPVMLCEIHDVMDSQGNVSLAHSTIDL